MNDNNLEMPVNKVIEEPKASKPKSSGLLWIIIIIGVLIFCLGAYLVFNREVNKNKTTTTTTTTTQSATDEVYGLIYSEDFNYTLNNHDEKITFAYYREKNNESSALFLVVLINDKVVYGQIESAGKVSYNLLLHRFDDPNSPFNNNQNITKEQIINHIKTHENTENKYPFNLNNATRLKGNEEYLVINVIGYIDNKYGLISMFVNNDGTLIGQVFIDGCDSSNLLSNLGESVPTRYQDQSWFHIENNMYQWLEMKNCTEDGDETKCDAYENTITINNSILAKETKLLQSFILTGDYCD